jgi:transposase
MGRSRGGLTTKIHALVDAGGLPIALKLTEGQAHDGRAADDMLASLGQGNILLGDAAYDSDALRQDLAARGAWACVKPMPNRRNVPAFSSFLYRHGLDREVLSQLNNREFSRTWGSEEVAFDQAALTMRRDSTTVLSITGPNGQTFDQDTVIAEINRRGL